MLLPALMFLCNSIEETFCLKKVWQKASSVELRHLKFIKNLKER